MSYTLESQVHTDSPFAELRIAAVAALRVDEVVRVGVVETQQVLSCDVHPGALQADCLEPCHLRNLVSHGETVKRNPCAADSPEA